MGINYYAKIKPSEKDRMSLISLIEEGKDYEAIVDRALSLYGINDMYNYNRGIVHLGKASAGWKFLWNPNQWKIDVGHYDSTLNQYIPEYRIEKYYDLTKKSISEFLRREDVTIYDEYGEEYTAEQFLNIALNHCVDGLDSNSAHKKKYEGFWDMSERQNMWRSQSYQFENIYQSDFYSDGLRFSISTDFN